MFLLYNKSPSLFSSFSLHQDNPSVQSRSATNKDSDRAGSLLQNIGTKIRQNMVGNRMHFVGPHRSHDHWKYMASNKISKVSVPQYASHPSPAGPDESEDSKITEDEDSPPPRDVKASHGDNVNFLCPGDNARWTYSSGSGKGKNVYDENPKDNKFELKHVRPATTGIH